MFVQIKISVERRSKCVKKVRGGLSVGRIVIEDETENKLPYVFVQMVKYICLTSQMYLCQV